MVTHVIPGDAYVETFKQAGIDGDVVVCRECLVDGPIDAESVEAFWQMRASFLTPENPSEYLENVVPEFNKLAAAGAGDQVFLWFEYELFCQVNMWFCVSLLANSGAEVYLVSPVTLSREKRWDGFARLTPEDFKTCFGSAARFSAEDIKQGVELWDAFRTDDREKLRELSTYSSERFPYLEEVCEAAIQKETEPARVLTGILMSGETDFGKIFAEFRAFAGIYGYGDTQVKRILDTL